MSGLRSQWVFVASGLYKVCATKTLRSVRYLLQQYRIQIWIALVALESTFETIAKPRCFGFETVKYPALILSCTIHCLFQRANEPLPRYRRSYQSDIAEEEIYLQKDSKFLERG